MDPILDFLERADRELSENTYLYRLTPPQSSFRWPANNRSSSGEFGRDQKVPCHNLCITKHEMKSRFHDCNMKPFLKDQPYFLRSNEYRDCGGVSLYPHLLYSFELWLVCFKTCRNTSKSPVHPPPPPPPS